MRSSAQQGFDMMSERSASSNDDFAVFAELPTESLIFHRYSKAHRLYAGFTQALDCPCSFLPAELQSEVNQSGLCG